MDPVNHRYSVLHSACVLSFSFIFLSLISPLLIHCQIVKINKNTLLSPRTTQQTHSYYLLLRPFTPKIVPNLSLDPPL